MGHSVVCAVVQIPFLSEEATCIDDAIFHSLATQ